MLKMPVWAGQLWLSLMVVTYAHTGVMRLCLSAISPCTAGCVAAAAVQHHPAVTQGV